MVLAYLGCFVECGLGWSSAFLVCIQTDLGACPLVCVAPDWSGSVQGMHFRKLMLPWCLDWLVLFSALWSVFKQAQGACTLDVSLRLVCSGLQLVRGFLPSQPLLAVD